MVCTRVDGHFLSIISDLFCSMALWSRLSLRMVKVVLDNSYSHKQSKNENPVLKFDVVGKVTEGMHEVTLNSRQYLVCGA